MRSLLFLSALAAVAVAAPQSLEIDEIEAVPDPVLQGPPVEAVSQTVTYNPAAAAASAVEEVKANPDGLEKREVSSLKRRGVPCEPQPDGYGPKPAEDTVEAFWSFPTFADLSTGAATPQGYELSFTNVRASVGGNGYMGLYTLKSYNTVTCAQICDRKAGCLGFNLYFERDPTVSPADACPNPPSFTNVKCTLWGNGVSEAAATNAGQYRGPEDANGDAFRVVITGSNGYNRKAPPAPIPNFTGPVQLGGAINAPLDNGYNTYMGVKFFKAPYDPAVCAAACQAQTAYNKRHAVDGKYRPCNFFAAYVLSKNNVPEGMYCSMYTRSWDRSYATNQGQWRGTDYYSVSHAYSFTLSPLEPVNR